MRRSVCLGTMCAACRMCSQDPESSLTSNSLRSPPAAPSGEVAMASLACMVAELESRHGQDCCQGTAKARGKILQGKGHFEVQAMSFLLPLTLLAWTAAQSVDVGRYWLAHDMTSTEAHPIDCTKTSSLSLRSMLDFGSWTNGHVLCLWHHQVWPVGLFEQYFTQKKKISISMFN